VALPSPRGERPGKRPPDRRRRGRGRLPKAKLSVGKTAAAYLRYEGFLKSKRVLAFRSTRTPTPSLNWNASENSLPNAARDLVLLGDKPANLAECRNCSSRRRCWRTSSYSISSSPAGPPCSKPTRKPLPPPAPPPRRRRPGHPTANGAGRRGRNRAQAQPVPKPTAPPPPPPPDAGPPSWAQDMLAKVVEQLRGRGQPVKPLGVEAAHFRAPPRRT